MKKKLPIKLSNLFFTDYTCLHTSNPSFSPECLDFDLRHDFLIDEDFAGIAAEILFDNLNHSNFKGVRRNVTARLFDATDRLLLISKQIKIYISGDSWMKPFRATFSASEIEYKAGHSYRLQLCDDNSGILFGEQCFHLYSIEQYGQPEKWYEMYCAGLIPQGDSNYLRSCDADSRVDKDYKIRFEICDNMPSPRPDIMPELEVRLYRPNGDIEIDFIEPRYAYLGDFTYRVERPFHAANADSGIYYVELLCMDTPLAGFTFCTDKEIPGAWHGSDIDPVEEYDYDLVCSRHKGLLPDEYPSEDEMTDEDYDALLDEFISSQLKEMDSDLFDSSNDSANSNASDPFDFSDSSDDSDDSNVSDPFDFSNNADNADNDDNAEYAAPPSLLSELDDLTGLNSVKEKIIAYDKLMRFNMLRAAHGLEIFHSPLHSMFLGSPGTGKTTVAKLMGAMLKRAGILSSGHVVECERSTLIGKYYNSEAEKTLEVIEQAQGGILFIDEAYSLFQKDDPKDPGKFVIEALLTALADPSKDDWMLILAGYPEEMKNLFELNSGFKSRIPESNIYTFEDFSEEQLIEIAERHLEKLQFRLTPDARKALHQRLSTDYAQRDAKFGNARHVMNLIQAEILPTMAVRVMDAGFNDTKSLSEIQASDIPMTAPKIAPRRKSVGFSFPTAS